MGGVNCYRGFMVEVESCWMLSLLWMIMVRIQHVAKTKSSIPPLMGFKNLVIITGWY